ncbi:MAG: ATP-dependent nuclease [Methylosarcina sp.]
MIVTSLKIQNFRSFENMDPIALDQINVIVGPNNAGKSSILRALHLLQGGNYSENIRENIRADTRIGASIAQIIIDLKNINANDWRSTGNHKELTADTYGQVKIELSSNGISRSFTKPDGKSLGIDAIPNREPYHFIVPFLSKRKVAGYDERVTQDNAEVIRNDFAGLVSKLSRLAAPGFPKHELYENTCKEILGFIVVPILSQNGQRLGVYLSDSDTISIDQMGEGIPNIIALLADLILSSGKLFLIEEPENDIHPQALKALLDLIVESSKKNQFVISTHSNIVVSYLASQSNSKLYNVTAEASSMPTVAIIQEVEPTVDARLRVLRELGYSFSDFDLWDGWLILEESSAERIIREYLIRWFAPKLMRIRTLSTNGVDQVAPTFDDFNRLVRFTHLEDAYRNAAWVRVDGDERGKKIVDQLRSRYETWSPDRFNTYTQDQFEYYYPSIFLSQVDETLSIKDRKEKRKAKKKLLDDVLAWIEEDEERARNALEKSAKEIIDDLKLIEKQISKKFITSKCI